jgi:hypothetical protein
LVNLVTSQASNPLVLLEIVDIEKTEVKIIHPETVEATLKGALPHRKATNAIRWAITKPARFYLCHRHEAALQDGRRTLPDSDRG